MRKRNKRHPVKRRSQYNLFEKHMTEIQPMVSIFETMLVREFGNHDRTIDCYSDRLVSRYVAHRPSTVEAARQLAIDVFNGMSVANRIVLQKGTPEQPLQIFVEGLHSRFD